MLEMIKCAVVELTAEEWDQAFVRMTRYWDGLYGLTKGQMLEKGHSLPEIIFIRDDDWAIGSTLDHAESAYSLYPAEWKFCFIKKV